MPLDLSGIDNVNEFYSSHYLDALVESDLNGLLDTWREQAEGGGTPPDKGLRGLKREFGQAQRDVLNALTDASDDVADVCTMTAVRFHTSLLAALGYPQRSSIADLDSVLLGDDGELEVPLRLALARDGGRHLFVIETPWLTPGQSMLQSPVLTAHQEGASEALEEVISQIFTLDFPPRWVMALGGQHVLLCERSRWSRGAYLLFSLETLFGMPTSQAVRATAARCGAGTS